MNFACISNKQHLTLQHNRTEQLKAEIKTLMRKLDEEQCPAKFHY